MNPYTERSLSPELGLKIVKRRVRALKNWRALIGFICLAGVAGAVFLDGAWSAATLASLVLIAILSFAIVENQEDLDVWEDRLAQKKQKEADRLLNDVHLPPAYSAVLLEEELRELGLRLSRHRRDVDELLEEL